MAVKYFCDCCKEELTRNVVSDRYRPTRYSNYTNFAAEVMVRVGTTWNSGHLCKPCLLTILTDPSCELNDRDAPGYAGRNGAPEDARPIEERDGERE